MLCLVQFETSLDFSCGTECFIVILKKARKRLDKTDLNWVFHVVVVGFNGPKQLKHPTHKGFDMCLVWIPALELILIFFIFWCQRNCFCVLFKWRITSFATETRLLLALLPLIVRHKRAMQNRRLWLLFDILNTSTEACQGF